ncbi:hypothetical protein HWV62_40766 [Athelia sp. TMB]|nr:hypothetical protein HWV62_40766 [Athelia sp. TMB]
MVDSDPTSFLVLDTSLLHDHVASRIRGPSGKPYALIKSTPHPTLPIAIYNYTGNVNTWDSLTLASRSFVVEPKTGVVLSRSFLKFFNHNKPFAYKPTGEEESVIIEEKLDGSIISLFWYHGTWHAISKSQFAGPYVDLANEILNQRYPGEREKLDKDRTYVFEMLDPKVPIGVKYTERDMVLLAIISKDGQEPRPDCIWSKLPFTRPRVLDAQTVDLNVLRKMNPVKEEGPVVKFYSGGTRRPQRLKVKFDSYLALIQSKSHISPAGILKVYIKSRGTIAELDPSVVRPHMIESRDKHLNSLKDISDDMGGDLWLSLVQDQWEQIDKHFADNERRWQQLVKTLKKDGFPGTESREQYRKRQFSARLGRGDVEPGLRQTLYQWFGDASVQAQIRCFLGTLSVPDGWKSKDALGERRIAVTVTPWK